LIGLILFFERKFIGGWCFHACREVSFGIFPTGSFHYFVVRQLVVVLYNISQALHSLY